MRFSFLLLILLSFILTNLNAQGKKEFEADIYDGTQQHIDSLSQKLSLAESDSEKADILFELSRSYWYSNLNTGIEYAGQSLKISESIHYKKGVFDANFGFCILYLNRGDANLSLEYANKSLTLAKEIGDKHRIASTYSLFGNIYYRLGNLPRAQQYCFAALKLAESLNYKSCIIRSYSSLGSINFELEDSVEVLKYYSLAFNLSKEIGNKIQIAANYHNIGSYYANYGFYEKGLPYFNDALKINNEIGNKLWAAYNNDAIGFVYENQERHQEALKYCLESARILKEIDERLKLSTTLNNVSSIYLSLHEYANAKREIIESIRLAKETEFLPGLYQSYETAMSIDTATANWKSAYDNYRMFNFYRDSVINKENTKKTVQTAMQYDFDKKESLAKAAQEKKDAIALKELQRQRLMRNVFVGGFSIVLLFAGIFFSQRNKIRKGKKLSDELLLNILPEEVAEELKEKGSADAKLFEDVTVMFTDFKGFTQISEQLTAAELVAEIHTCFKAFDGIITKYNIEKIKTIGDSYMCAAGLPVVNNTHADDIVNAAIEIQEFMNKHLQERKNNNMLPFEIRIGVHSGPVVAGIVGVKKFAYDIWGDTVNIASRMESSGEAGKINISGSTFILIKEKFNCVYRGKIQAKNKGEIDMYFVEKQFFLKK